MIYFRYQGLHKNKQSLHSTSYELYINKMFNHHFQWNKETSWERSSDISYASILNEHCFFYLQISMNVYPVHVWMMLHVMTTWTATLVPVLTATLEPIVKLVCQTYIDLFIYVSLIYTFAYRKKKYLNLSWCGVFQCKMGRKYVIAE